jgi:catechol 1,2-dioxygenase
MDETASVTTPEDITARAIASFDLSQSERLGTVMRALVLHLHEFAREVQLTTEEWEAAVAVVTATGHITDAHRQEWILWSDALGLSMLVDRLNHDGPAPATESTVLGPFYVPGAPARAYGARLDELPAGEPAWVHGRVLSLEGTPLAGAELDVWQNGDNELYAVQDANAPEEHLRGRFRTRGDGTFGFLAVRPSAYRIPADGPVGQMLAATGRHPWRPAHIHVIVRAAGHRTLTTHVFDAASMYVESDAVFAVKPSLLRHFERRTADDPERPPGVEGDWWSLRTDFVLVPGAGTEPTDPGRSD